MYSMLVVGCWLPVSGLMVRCTNVLYVVNFISIEETWNNEIPSLNLNIYVLPNKCYTIHVTKN